MRRSLSLRRRACWEPTDWRSSASSSSSRSISVLPGAAGDDRRLVQRVGELGAGHPGRLAGDVGEVEVVGQRLALGVGAEDRLAAVAVGRRDQHLAVEAARPQQRLVELVDVVGGGDHDHRRPLSFSKPSSSTSSWFSACSRSLVPPSPPPPERCAADRVELVDEDHRAAGLARLLEEAADAGGAAADEHLDEARAGGGEEVDPGLGGDGAGEHRLAGPGRAVEEDAARRLRAERARSGPGRGATRRRPSARPWRRRPPAPPPRATGLVLRGLHRLRLGRADRRAHQAQEDEQQHRHEEDPEDGVPVEEEFLDGFHRSNCGETQVSADNGYPSRSTQYAKERVASVPSGGAPARWQRRPGLRALSRGRPGSRRRSPLRRSRRRRSRPCCRRRSRAPRASASRGGPRP